MGNDVATGPRPIASLDAPPDYRRRKILGVGSVVVVLGLSLIAALVTGGGLSPVTGSVEHASSTGSSFLRDLSVGLPMGYAFGAGMVAAVNPCGFALLPAYLGLYLGDRSAGETRGRVPRLGQALLVSASVTAGFVLLFGATGLVLGSVTVSLTRIFPWLGLIVGVALVIAAGRMLTSGGLYTGLGEQLSARVTEVARHGNVTGYFAYGIGYGLASLSCTLPIFLALAGGALTTQRLASSFAEYVLYGLGMGFVITVLTLIVALFKIAAIQRVRQLGRFVQPVSSVLLLLAGGYIVYYWLTIGGLLASVR